MDFGMGAAAPDNILAETALSGSTRCSLPHPLPYSAIAGSLNRMVREVANQAVREGTQSSGRTAPKKHCHQRRLSASSPAIGCESRHPVAVDSVDPMTAVLMNSLWGWLNTAPASARRALLAASLGWML